jgi:transposase
LLLLSQDERKELSGWSQSRTLPAGDVFRARLILALADGWSYSEIEQKLDTSAPTIARWRARFEQDRMEGLNPRHQGSRPRVVTPAVQARIVRHTLDQPKDGSTHWTCRKLGKKLGVSKSTVQRVWTQAQLKPHRLDRYMASDDPEFENKAAAIIGLYLNPPQHAAVFCVDEKTAIQALDRLDPVLPMSPGRAERHGFEYYRHGTLSLYAALNVKSGKVTGKTASRHTSAEFIKFLNDIVQQSQGARAIQHRAG